MNPSPPTTPSPASFSSESRARGFIDQVPFSTCLVLAGIAIAIIALSVLWSWRMADDQLQPHTTGPVIPVGTLGIHVGLFATGRSASPPVSGPGYEWVDRAHGIVRVPIDVAMDIYLERGRQ